MRNAIKYYYNIDVEVITSKNDNYYFDNYILRAINRKFNYAIYDYFLRNNIFIYKIKKNIFNRYETIIYSKKYILVNVDRKINLNLEHLLPLYVNYNQKEDIKWTVLWKRKVDYYESMIEKIGDKEIKNLFPYYIGMCENAIKYFDENVENDYSICFSHERLYSSIDFFCPDNLIIDCKARDLSEFVKYSFYKGSFNLDDFIYFIEKIFLKKDDYIMLYSRLLFPTYFFDCIEFNKNILLFSSKVNQYEKLLSDIIFELNKKVNIPFIEWITKKI